MYELRLGVDTGSNNELTTDEQMLTVAGLASVDMPNGDAAAGDGGENGVVCCSDSSSTMSDGPLNHHHHHNNDDGSPKLNGSATIDDPTAAAPVSLCDAPKRSKPARVEWRHIRFPTASDALDEYARWPRLKFRVAWHGTGIEAEGARSVDAQLLDERENARPPKRMQAAMLSPARIGWLCVCVCVWSSGIVILIRAGTGHLFFVSADVRLADKPAS